MQPKYGHQEGARFSCNPTKPGRRSFHPLLAIISGRLLCPAYRFGSSDTTVSASQCEPSMEEAA